jgi:hypothetical protein
MILSENRFPLFRIMREGGTIPLFESEHPRRELRPFSNALPKFAPVGRAAKAACRRNAVAQPADREAVGARQRSLRLNTNQTVF